MDLFVQIGIDAVVGLLLQLLVALLLCSAFLAQREPAGAGGYARFWHSAWLAQAVAVGTLVMLFLFTPNLDIHYVGVGSVAAPLVFLSYASAKMVMWACLLSGCARFQWQGIPAAGLRFLFGTGQVLALVSLTTGTRTSDVVNFTYVVILFASLCCAGAVLGVPQARRSRASRALGTVFALNTLDLLGLTVAVALPPPPEGRWIVNYNSYVDRVLHLALAGCMIWVARTDPRSGSAPPAGARSPRSPLGAVGSGG